MTDHPEDPWTPDDKTSPPTPLGELLTALVGRRQWTERLEGAAIFRCWDELVGPQLARRCQPVRLSGGVLVVRAEDNAWAAQLGYLEAALLQRVDEVLRPGLVHKLKVMVGPTPGSRSSASPP